MLGNSLFLDVIHIISEEVCRPVKDVEHGKAKRKRDPGDDIDPL